MASLAYMRWRLRESADAPAWLLTLPHMPLSEGSVQLPLHPASTHDGLKAFHHLICARMLWEA